MQPSHYSQGVELGWSALVGNTDCWFSPWNVDRVVICVVNFFGEVIMKIYGILEDSDEIVDGDEFYDDVFNVWNKTDLFPGEKCHTNILVRRELPKYRRLEPGEQTQIGDESFYAIDENANPIWEAEESVYEGWFVEKGDYYRREIK